MEIEKADEVVDDGRSEANPEPAENLPELLFSGAAKEPGEPRLEPGYPQSVGCGALKNQPPATESWNKGQSSHCTY